MKKTRNELKLQINRETLRALEQPDLREVLGGATANTCYKSCLPAACPSLGC